MKTKQPAVLTFLITLTVLCNVLAQDPTPGSDNELRFFAEEIEPLLASHCFPCHSHDANEMEGGLTLDSRSGWANGGESGPAVVPGEPEKSLLIRAIRHAEKNLQMPPDEKLPDEVIDLFVDWIRRGAADSRKSKTPINDDNPLDWWSLQPLSRPNLPVLADRKKLYGAVANEIDAFILKQIQAKGLAVLPKADRRTLIRRLYADLHGLPPTPAEVTSFLSDPDPLAYEKLVDRLLASPRYGERWARHWLDTVHFADSHGCEHDIFRPNAWRYRDYVIQSLNRDTRWPRFIREQLAADWFYPEDSKLTPALGFIAAGPLELSRAGTAPVTFDYLDRDDIVTQTMAAFASTTANCARCHDHKFDPISQEDYYSLQAVFAGAGKGDLEYDADPKIAKKRKKFTELLSLATGSDKMKLPTAEYENLISDWEKKIRNNPTVWEPLLPRSFVSSDGATLKRLEDDSLIASETRPERDTYTISATSSLSRVQALRLDVLPDDSLPMKGPGRCDNGNLHLSEIKVFVLDDDSSKRIEIGIKQATADWNQQGWTIAHSLDGNPATAWGIYPKVGEAHYAVFELTEPVDMKPSSQLVFQLDQHHGGGHLIGRLKLYAADSDPRVATVLPNAVYQAIKKNPIERTDQQSTAIAAYVLQRHAEEQLAKLPKPVAVYAWSKLYSHAKKLALPMEPKVVHILSRGDIDKPGKVAVPGALAVLDHAPGRFDLDDQADEASRRAALADWLAAKDNPLTWRSIVNRVWSYHFGRGLCDTPNDFGRMGGTPSHPELLDWLAVWFRDDAQGSLKQLHRLILLSETWQRCARVPNSNPAIRESQSTDAQNRLLWRQNLRPLDAESFRDSILQVSGRIDLKMGGSGIQQFTQSKGRQDTPELDYDGFDWNHPSAARRSIYRVVWRGISDPFMESLGFPDLGLLSPKRDFSVSALQALTLFNDDFVLHHCQVLAQKLQAEHANLEQQLTEACRLIMLREPDAKEMAWLVDYSNKHGLAAVCRILLNSNEFIFID